MNISSLIVIPHPDQGGDVERGLLEIEGAEIHAISPDGKFVVTLEAEDDATTASLFDRVAALPGVMSAAMVYQHSEPNPDEEITVHSIR
ncbi:MAG: chaperone NapD [Rhodocyclaceae bacterium]|nr:chaperone NapD [Rhodocyclaceae bacterium]